MQNNKKNYDRAFASFQKAVEAEDTLIYNEPRDWLLPSRQYLGNALLKAKKYKDAVAVFKSDLTINPANGWDLTGIEQALTMTNSMNSLPEVQRRKKSAWVIKDVKIDNAVF